MAQLQEATHQARKIVALFFLLLCVVRATR